MESTPEAVSANTRSRCALKRKALLKGLEIVKRKRAPKSKRKVAKQLNQSDENMNSSNIRNSGRNALNSSASMRRKIHANSELKPMDSSGNFAKAESTNHNGAVQEGEVAIEKVVVLRAEDILPVEDPALECGAMQANIDSQNWLIQYETIDSIRRLVIHHLQSIEPCIDVVLPFLRKSADSLRSAQSRNALLAMQEVFKFAAERSKTVLLSGIGQTIDVVLTKSVNDKRFIAMTGVDTLKQISKSVSSFQLLSALLKHTSSKSVKVLTQVGVASQICVRGMDVKAEVSEAKVGQLIKSVMLLETGRSVEARKYAQDIVRELSRSLGSSMVSAEAVKVLQPSDMERFRKIIAKPRKPAGEKRPSLKEVMMHRRRQAKGQ